MKCKDRSSHVFAALKQVTSRYELCRLSARTTRAMHVRDRRMQDTMNESLMLAGYAKRGSYLKDGLRIYWTSAEVIQ